MYLYQVRTPRHSASNACGLQSLLICPCSLSSPQRLGSNQKDQVGVAEPVSNVKAHLGALVVPPPEWGQGGCQT